MAAHRHRRRSPGQGTLAGGAICALGAICVPASLAQTFPTPGAPTTPVPNSPGNFGSSGAQQEPHVLMQRNPTDGPKPSSGSAPEDDRMLHISADSTHTVDSGDDRGTIIGEGHVHLTWRGYVITCDRATFNPDRHVATFESNVVMDTGVQTVYADYVSFNLRTREFSARQARSIVPQSYLGPNVLQPIRIFGEEVTREGDIVTARNGVLTTCDYPDPHYRIGFAQATMIPNRRIVLRDAVFYDSQGKAVARVKYLAIPISDQVRYTYLPQIGRTEEEGYYVKTAVGYTGSKQLPAGILRLDLMEKKGIGLGIDQAYKFGKDAIGTFVLYSLRDQGRHVDDLNGSLNHQERIGTVLLTVASNFQNNSYTSISPESKSSQNTITLSRVVGPSNTNITYNVGTSSYSGLSTSRNSAYALTQTQTFGPFSSVTFDLTGTESDSDSFSANNGPGTSNVRTQQLGDIKATGRAGIFDLSLTANKNLLSRATLTTTNTDGTSTTQNSDYFSGTERLPDVSLTTDTTRLGFLKSVPTKFTLGWGELVDGTPEDRVFTQRGLFDLNTTPPPIPLTRGGRLSLTENGDFRQILYSQENAAQYILTNQTALTQKFSSIDSLSFTYGYLRPYGGEPIGFTVDQTGSNNNLGANYTLNGGGVKLTLLTGYDIQRANEHDLPAGFPRNPWQNLSVQLAVRNSDKFQTRFTSSYDWNTGRLLQTTNQMRIRAANGPSLDTNLSFDPATRKFPQVTGTLQTPLFRPDVNLAAYVGYNGLTYRFDYRTFTLTKSYHDYEISLGYVNQPYGFRTQTGINFSIRLKAFPAFSPPPAGQFGTAIDTSNSAPIF